MTDSHLAFASTFVHSSGLRARVSVVQRRPPSAARAPQRQTPRAMDELCLGALFHNGATWSSGLGGILVDFAVPLRVIADDSGGGGGTVQPAGETVLKADLCDISGEGCRDDGTPPADAMIEIGAETKASRVKPGVNRGFIDYSGGASVFVGDDTIAV